MKLQAIKTRISQAALVAGASVLTFAEGELAAGAKVGIDAAKGEGMAVGAMVVGAVALLAVVGIVISMVKKA